MFFLEGETSEGRRRKRREEERGREEGRKNLKLPCFFCGLFLFALRYVRSMRVFVRGTLFGNAIAHVEGVRTCTASVNVSSKAIFYHLT